MTVSHLSHQSAWLVNTGWDAGQGAYLNLGDVEDGYTVEVNGHALGNLDQLDTAVDIGPHLKAGTNTVTVTVASTLYNAANPAAGKAYGLLGDSCGHVVVTPYRKVRIHR